MTDLVDASDASDAATSTRQVPPGLHGARADRAVAELFDLPVATARLLIAAGRARVDERPCKKGDTVRAGQAVSLPGQGRWLVPVHDERVLVLREEADLLVVDKLAGMPCHPLVPGEGGTVVDALAARYPEIEHASPAAPRDAGLVHRLDTGTSGCLAVARTAATWRALREAFASDQVEKRYLALVEGELARAHVVNGPIAHDPADARRMRVDDAGRAATSEVRPVAAGPAASLVEVVMHGGRRHQIRVHLASCGHPIVGDVLYQAAAAADAPAPLLHARSLLLPGRPRVVAPLPPALVAAARARGLAVEPEHP